MLFSPNAVLAAMLVMSPIANAHIIMAVPAPWGTPNNSPLDKTGTDFPCKAIPPSGPSTPWVAGSSVQVAFTGSAVHSGGSCQVSVTTDKAPTKASKWKVILSIEGGCPSPPSPGANGNFDSNPVKDAGGFDFTVPSELPDGDLSMAWTWFNHEGNREMYMNCATVSVTGGSKDTTAFDSLPDMAVANIHGDGKCKTTEGLDYNFDNPGKQIIKGPTAKGPFGPLMAAGEEERCRALAMGGPSTPSTGAGGNAGAPGAPVAPTTPGVPSPAVPADPGVPPQAPTAPANPGMPSQAPANSVVPTPPQAAASGVTSTVRQVITITAPSGPVSSGAAPSSGRSACSKNGSTPASAKPSSGQGAASAPPAAAPLPAVSQVPGASQAPAASAPVASAPIVSKPGASKPAGSAPAPVASAPASPVPSDAAPPSGQACSPDGSIVCSADGTQFALCNWGKAIFKSVAAGTSCQSGKIAKRADYASTLRTVYA